jgi:hypothetical protein
MEFIVSQGLVALAYIKPGKQVTDIHKAQNEEFQKQLL